MHELVFLNVEFLDLGAVKIELDHPVLDIDSLNQAEREALEQLGYC